MIRRVYPGARSVLLALALVLPLSGCSLVGSFLSARSASPPDRAVGPAASRPLAAASARKAPRAVTSVFLWGPVPPTLPEGGVAYSTLPERILNDMPLDAGQRIAWRRVPTASPLMNPALRASPTGRRAWGPAGVALRALAPVAALPSLALGSLWTGLDPTVWHATPWATGPGRPDWAMADSSFWLMIELQWLGFLPHFGVPVAHR